MRQLVEAVYSENTWPIPEALQKASHDQDGKGLADNSQANFNALKLQPGYGIDTSPHWDEDSRLPTRLADESLTVYLARDDAGGLRSMRDDKHSPCEYSALRVNLFIDDYHSLIFMKFRIKSHLFSNKSN